MITLIVLVFLTLMLTGLALVDYTKEKNHYSNVHEAKVENVTSNECSQIDYDFFEMKR